MRNVIWLMDTMLGLTLSYSNTLQVHHLKAVYPISILLLSVPKSTLLSKTWIMADSAFTTTNANLNYVTLTFVEVDNKVKIALPLRTVIPNSSVKRRLSGLSRVLAGYGVSMGITARPIMIVTLKQHVGIRPLQICKMAQWHAWTSTHLMWALNSDGRMWQVIICKMLYWMGKCARVGGPRMLMGWEQLNVCRSYR